MLLASFGLAAAPAEPTPHRQSFDIRIPVPLIPVPVAGTQHLVYELHLSNFSAKPLILQRLEVLDAKNKTVIADLDAPALATRLGRPGAGQYLTDAPTLAAGMSGVLYLELPLTDPIPQALEHQITFRSPEQDPGLADAVRSVPVPVHGGQAVVLGPPLRGGPWAAVYHPSWQRGHRRVIHAFGGQARIPDRLAIDWVRLDANGARAILDEDLVRNWHGYDAEVLAVADALVVATRNDIPESDTLSGRFKYEFEDATGNLVVLDLGDSRYAIYKHLKPGSVRVAPGERVRLGQVIGAVGFSGSAGGPQLHFHLADAPSPLGAAEGLPYVIDQFNLLGGYDNFESFGKSPWTPIGKDVMPRRTAEFPTPNAVVDFGQGSRQAGSTPTR
ncbi:M23 family metallopeptidase [Bowmanella dokdonensis]